MTDISPFDDKPKDEFISVLDLLIIIAKNINIIFIVFFVILLHGIVKVNKNDTPVYVSEATIHTTGTGGNSGISVIATQFGINLPAGQSDAQLDIATYIKSRTFARRMMDRKFDTEKFGSQKSLLQILTYGNSEPTVGIDTLIQAGINGFFGMVEIEQSGNLQVIKISSSEPKFSYDLLKSLLEELNLHQKENKSIQLSETRQFIEERLFVAESELQTAEEALSSFRQRNRQIGNSPSLLLEQERLARNVSVLIGVFTGLKQQLESTKIEEVKVSGSILVFESPEIPLSPLDPQKRKRIIMFGLIGIGMGVFMGFLKEYIDNRTKKDQEKLNKLKSLVLMKFKWLNHLINIWNKGN